MTWGFVLCVITLICCPGASGWPANKSTRACFFADQFGRRVLAVRFYSLACSFCQSFLRSTSISVSG